MPIRRLSAALVGALAVACSSGTNADSCTCDISYNGVQKALSCGESACINGENFSCAPSGTADEGACGSEAPAKREPSPPAGSTQAGDKPPSAEGAPDAGGSPGVITSETFACGELGLTCKTSVEFCLLMNASHPQCVGGGPNPAALCQQFATRTRCRCRTSAGGVF